MLQFSQNEIEGQLDDCYPYGSVKQIAIVAHRHPTQLAGELCPNDTRKSNAYEFLQIQCALDEKYPEQGDKHWQYVTQFRELSKPQTTTGLCITTAALSNHKESFDVADAVMRGKPLLEQLGEVCEQISAAEKHKQAILEAIHKEKTSANGSNSRYARSSI